MKSSEADIQDAISRFLAGDFRSLRHCADVTRINRQTIMNQLVGTLPQKEAHQNA